MEGGGFTAWYSRHYHLREVTLDFLLNILPKPKLQEILNSLSQTVNVKILNKKVT